MLEAVDGGLYLLEVLEVPEMMRGVPICMLEAMRGVRLCMLEAVDDGLCLWTRWRH